MIFSSKFFNVEYFWTILSCTIGFLVLIGNLCLIVAQYKIKGLRKEVDRRRCEEKERRLKHEVRRLQYEAVEDFRREQAMKKRRLQYEAAEAFRRAQEERDRKERELEPSGAAIMEELGSQTES